MADKIDAIDLKILSILQERGRITNLQLSSEIGLSPAPTLERVRKLEKRGYIPSYHAQVNHEKLGIGLQAFIEVSLARQRENAIHNFITAVMEIEEIVECYQVTGEFDYQLKVMTKDIAAFDQLITERLSTIDEIGHMQSYIILSSIKSSRSVPLLNYEH
ncbi:MAG: Lrp/AsnC family transcriptional regulator [Salibacteraceae bacterium]